MDGLMVRAPGSRRSSSRDSGSLRGSSVLSTASVRSFLSDAFSEKFEDECSGVPRIRTGTIMSSWSVMANTILGVGMLALPWAACQVGWLVSGTLLVLAAFFAYLSLHLLSRVALEIGGQDTTFYSCCLEVAPRWRYFVDMAIAVKCFGVATSYLQVIAQTMLFIFRPSGPDRLLIRLLILLAVVLVVAPVAFRRRIGQTRFTNWISLAAIMYVWVLLITFCTGGLVGGWHVGKHDLSAPIADRTSLGPPNVVQVLTTVPVFIFAFTCHQNLFPVVNELKDPSVSRMSCVAASACTTAFVMYGACIVLGYSVFGSDIDQNYLLSLPKVTAATVGSVLMAASNGLSFPLQNHPCRRSMAVLMSSVTRVNYEYPHVRERWLRRSLTCFILFGTVAVATMVDDLGIVFAIVGTVGSNTICYIMPGLLYVCTFRGKAGTSRVLLVLAVIQLCIGLIVLPTCLFAIFYQALTTSHQS